MYVDACFQSHLPVFFIMLYMQVCRDISQIKICMETGRTVILLNLENLYESLYDLLNQVYIRISYCSTGGMGPVYNHSSMPKHRSGTENFTIFSLLRDVQKPVSYIDVSFCTDTTERV